MESPLKQGVEQPDGRFTVRTEDLGARGHAELEIVDVPREGVEAAAKLIDYVVETVVDGGGRLKAGENVGIPLTIEGDDETEALFVGVHAIQSPSSNGGGFFSRLLGGSKVPLRLVGLFDHASTPLCAVTTVMLFRANCRMVERDVEGAVRELEESIAIFPGDPDAGPPPESPVEGAALNWQNHLGYLRLAELLDGQGGDAALDRALRRFDWLAERRLGCSVTELAELDPDTLTARAADVLEHNLKNKGYMPGPHHGLCLVNSPVWTRHDGTATRVASLVPPIFADYYYGAAFEDEEARRVAAETAASCLAKWREAPSCLEDFTLEAISTYVGSDPDIPPIGDEPGSYQPGDGALSALLAAIARCLAAGATAAEVRALLGVDTDETLAASAARKLDALAGQETEAFMAAMFG